MADHHLAGGIVRATAMLAAASAIVLACSVVPGLNATIRREEFVVYVVVPGYREPDTQGYLCPRDPGEGPLVGEVARRRLLEIGCLDLGRTAEVPAEAPGWTAEIRLESLASAQLEPFNDRSTYRLILVTGDESGGRSISVDVPAVNLVP
jgi:hypothetical protein